MFRCFCVFVLLHAWALAGVRVTPGAVTVAAGSTCAFTATLDGKQPPGGWRWSVRAGLGTIDEATGLRRGVPRRRGCGPCSGATSAGRGRPPSWCWRYRMGCPAPLSPGSTWLAGYGVPFAPFVFIPAPEEPVDAVRLTYREGNQWHRRDLDSTQMEMTCRGPVTSCCIEALKRSGQHPGQWRSTIVPCRVEVRGALPHCGNAVAPGGHEDGVGLAARFVRPFGLAHLSGSPGGSKGLLLVTDPGHHVLRTVTAEGEVATLCGQPGPGRDPVGIDPGWAARASLEFAQALVPFPDAVVDEAFVVTFQVSTALPVIHFTADFLDPDGEGRARVRDMAVGGQRVAVPGRFTQAGAGTVRIRGVTDQGVSAWTDLKVRVR